MMALISLIYLSFSCGPDFIAPAQPDTNFKSIHQLESEQYKVDSMNKKIKIKKNLEKKPVSRIIPTVGATINYVLLILIIILLIFIATIFLVARRIYLEKK
ncbi:MAG: hypothetical protein ABIL70_04085 [candidate division WOR-3 bacterium]